MTTATAESRRIENQLVANMAELRDAQASGYRRALIAAAARDLVWREGRATAAEALYAIADHWATADLAETGRMPLPPAGSAKEDVETGPDAGAEPERRSLLSAVLPPPGFDRQAAVFYWLSGFAAGAVAMALAARSSWI